MNWRLLYYKKLFKPFLNKIKIGIINKKFKNY